MRFVVILSIAIQLFACKNSTSTVDTSENNAIDLYLSFISKGAGIDGSAKEKVDAIIHQFELDNKLTIDKEVIKWGREGEKDYCFQLDNLSKKKKKAFIALIEKTVLNNDKILFSTSKGCLHKR